MSASSAAIVDTDIQWNPARGPVGMYCLIAAEACIFSIFVVAYVFYIGKSLTGPQPATFSSFRYSRPSVCSPAV